MYTGFLFCEHCSVTIHHPIWIRVDHDEHRPVCRACYREIDRTFTPEAAIAEACALIANEPLIIRPRYKIGGAQW